MAKRLTGMGRGLDALLPPEDISNRLNELKSEMKNKEGKEGTETQALQKTQVPGVDFQELALKDIQPASDQPRKYFDELTISELAQSIFKRGLLQPILVVPFQDGKYKYRIIAGERRFRAFQVLKKSHIPAIIKAVSEVERFELALVENIQRENLSPIEEALAYEHLLRISGSSQQEIAEKLGKGRSALANSLRLLQLPPTVQEGLSKGLIRSGHARALLMIKDAKALLEAYRLCVDESWSVRQTEKYSQDFSEGKTSKQDNFQAQELQDLGQEQNQQTNQTPSKSAPQAREGYQGNVSGGNTSESDTSGTKVLGNVPGLWHANGIPLRKKDLQARIAKSMKLDILNLQLDGELPKSEQNQPGACPQKATLEVEFHSKEDWQRYLSALGLPITLSSGSLSSGLHSSTSARTVDKIKNSTLEISIDRSKPEASEPS